MPRCTLGHNLSRELDSWYYNTLPKLLTSQDPRPRARVAATIFVISQNFVFVLAIKERKDKEERCHGLCAGDKEDG